MCSTDFVQNSRKHLVDSHSNWENMTAFNFIFPVSLKWVKIIPPRKYTIKLEWHYYAFQRIAQTTWSEIKRSPLSCMERTFPLNDQFTGASSTICAWSYPYICNKVWTWLAKNLPSKHNFQFHLSEATQWQFPRKSQPFGRMGGWVRKSGKVPLIIHAKVMNSILGMI